MSEKPSAFAEQDPFLFNLLNNASLTETEVNILLTELFQGGIDAVVDIILRAKLKNNVIVRYVLITDFYDHSHDASQHSQTSHCARYALSRVGRKRAGTWPLFSFVKSLSQRDSSDEPDSISQFKNPWHRCPFFWLSCSQRGNLSIL